MSDAQADLKANGLLNGIYQLELTSADLKTERYRTARTELVLIAEEAMATRRALSKRSRLGFRTPLSRELKRWLAGLEACADERFKATREAERAWWFGVALWAKAAAGKRNFVRGKLRGPFYEGYLRAAQVTGQVRRAGGRSQEPYEFIVGPPTDRIRFYNDVARRVWLRRIATVLARRIASLQLLEADSAASAFNVED